MIECITTTAKRVTVYTHDPSYFDRVPLEKQRICVTCDHYHAVDGRSVCDVDGHTIGYVQCFEAWCRRWKCGEWKGGSE